MPATSTPITLEALTGLQHGEEQTLERLFREHYAALVEEAKPIVGDDASASKAVERAFARVWKERSAIDSPESLTAFLHEAVHDQAKVALHRRVMLHRIEEHEGAKAHAGIAATGAISVDDAWKRVNDAIHTVALDRKELAREVAESSRHEAASHLGAVGKERSIKGPIAAAVVVIAALAGGLYYVDRAGDDSAIVRATSGTDARQLKSATGQLGNVTLDDSTAVRIGADSKLFIAPRFPQQMRAVRVDGAATFDVKPIAEKPFHLVAGPALITVTGTKLEVNSYVVDSMTAIKLVDGSATVKTEDSLRTIPKGGTLAFGKDGKVMPAPADAFGWADGRFTVADRQLRYVLKQFTRWYGLDLKVLDNKLLDRSITFDASLDSSRAAIAALEKASGLEFAYEGKTMLLREPVAGAKKGKK